jgi:DNA polymerase-3 subunit alpha
VFGDLPQALRGTLELAERCRFELPLGRLELPEFRVPPGETLESHLRKLAEAGLAERLTGDPGRPLPRGSEPYAQRLAYELDVIARCGYAGYFLIVWDLIRFARERGIPVGPGRGSSAGSLAAWSLRIVDVDPVELDIPFERFLNPERVSMPDIDMDFCMNRRAEVVRYVEQKYNGEGDGERRVAGIVTFGTMQARAALRDVGRVLGLPFGDVDRVAKLVPTTLGITLDEAFKSSRELRESVERDPKLQELYALARAVEGQIRNPGKHAAGIVISRGPLLETSPLYRDPRTGEVLTQFDYRSVERIGLVKFDLLGLRTLTIIHDAVSRIRATRDPGFAIEGAARDDAATFDLLGRGDTEGVFQVGQSGGMTDLVMKMRPRHLRDLIPLVALYRPGPLQSGMADDFINRRNGKTRVEYLLPGLEEILAETYGVIVYQDQVLKIANRLASFTLGEGDLLRRAMGKKIPEEMEAQRARFVEGCVTNGHPRARAEQLFEIMAQFAGYGFPKAHAAAYAVITHQTAFLKAHFAPEFIAATMTAEWREHDKLSRYMRDAAARGIRMRPPCVNESGAVFDVTDGGGAIRFGLTGIKNVGEGAVEAIVEAREAGGPFVGLADFCARVDPKRVNRRVVESLVRCGAFDFRGAPRAALFQGLDALLESGAKLQRDRAAGQGSLFGGGAPEVEPPLPDVPEWPEAQRLAGEKEILGFYLTGHPLRAHADALARFADVVTSEIAEAHRGRTLRLVGMLGALSTRKTRAGGLMAKAVLEDLAGTLDVVIFPAVFDRYAELLRQTDPVLVKGQIQLETERAEFQLEEVIPLSEAWSSAVRALELRVGAPLVSRARLSDLRALLDLAPGSVPVSFRIELEEGTEALLELTRHKVSVTPDWVARVEALFGARVVQCRC